MGCQLSKLGRRCRIYRLEGDKNSEHQQVQPEASTASTRKRKGASDAPAGTPGPVKSCTAAAQPKAKLDPKDFMFVHLKSETKVKLPGTVNGQQFIIDGCQDCNLYVMDACAMVTIDDCKNCRIFIGPTESSIFMRDCSNCKLSCITRQLRTRDCHTCDVLLHTRTRPIIESSSRVGLGCYSSPYAGLAQQMELAQLGSFHNFWSDVFDFTPNTGSAPAAENQSNEHWHLLPAAIGLQEHMSSVPDEVLQLLYGPLESQEAAATVKPQNDEAAAAAAATLTAADQQAVICTAGHLCDIQQIAEGCFAFLLFPPGQRAAAQQWVAAQFPSRVREGSLGSKPSTPAGADTKDAEGAAAGATECIADVQDITLDVPDVGHTVHDDSNQPQAATASTATAAAPAANPDILQPQQQHVLLRTNEAAIPVDILQPMATAADWTPAQVKQLNAHIKAANAAAVSSTQKHACCIGLEVLSCSVEQQHALCAEAAKLGALSCTSFKAAALFRNLGTDG